MELVGISLARGPLANLKTRCRNKFGMTLRYALIMKKIFITGGHYTPAKAVIDLLINKYQIFYLGRKYAMEDDDAIALEYQSLKSLKSLTYLVLTTGRLQRRFFVNIFQSIKSFFKIFVGLGQSFYYLIKFRPDLVLSFGGYLAAPVVFNSWLFRIPVITHEQTLIPGLSNKVINIFANKMLTGNPIRKEILDLKPVKTSGIFVTGGNQGSHVINMAVKNLFNKYSVILQTGDSKFNDYENFKRDGVYKFLDAKEMAKFLNEADLVISRAGANITTELAYLGKPAILIPIPWSSGNEQMLNAKFLKDAGTAEILEQKDLTGESLLKLVDLMFKNLGKYQHKVPVKTDAAEEIVKECEKLLY